jgi:ribosomal protein L11 methyltransferase
MALYELRIELPGSALEGAMDVVWELPDNSWSGFEDATSQRAWLIGIFASEVDAWASWARLRPLLPVAPTGEVSARELPDADWKDSYKEHFKAWQFGPLHWVPSWERETFVPPEGEQVLWLDPGMAFGTGNHETTRLCCERLVKFAADRGTSGRVLDAGCGSGILALSAARLGFVRVAAFDNDPVAVAVSRDNAVLNGLQGRVEFFTGDLAAGLTGRQADLVLANLQADVLVRFARELCEVASPGGRLVLSGILERELAQVCGVYSAAAPTARLESRVLGEWTDLVLTRPG